MLSSRPPLALLLLLSRMILKRRPAVGRYPKGALSVTTRSLLAASRDWHKTHTARPHVGICIYHFITPTISVQPRDCFRFFHRCILLRTTEGLDIRMSLGPIAGSVFKLQPCYYVHFRTNTLGKDMNHLFTTSYVLIVPLLFFYQSGFYIK